MARWKRFRAGRDGTLTVSLAEEELGLLRALPEQLREVFESDVDDPVRSRLFPRAYLDPTAETEEAEWQSLVGPSLLRERLDALELITSTLRPCGAGGRLVADRPDARRGAGVAGCAQRHAAGARARVSVSPRRSARSIPPIPMRGRMRCTSGSRGCRVIWWRSCCDVQRHEDAFRSMIVAYAAGDRDTMSAALADDLVAYVTNADGGVDEVRGASAYMERVPGGDATYSADVTQVVSVSPSQVLAMVEIKAERKGRALHNHAGLPRAVRRRRSNRRALDGRRAPRVQRRVLVVATRPGPCGPNVRSIEWGNASRSGSTTFFPVRPFGRRARDALVGVVGRGAFGPRRIRGGSVDGSRLRRTGRRAGKASRRRARRRGHGRRSVRSSATPVIWSGRPDRPVPRRVPARAPIATVAAAAACPATSDALADGSLSLAQAQEIVRAESAVPGSERRAARDRVDAGHGRAARGGAPGRARSDRS